MRPTTETMHPRDRHMSATEAYASATSEAERAFLEGSSEIAREQLHHRIRGVLFRNPPGRLHERVDDVKALIEDYVISDITSMPVGSGARDTYQDIFDLTVDLIEQGVFEGKPKERQRLLKKVTDELYHPPLPASEVTSAREEEAKPKARTPRAKSPAPRKRTAASSRRATSAGWRLGKAFAKALR